MHAVLAYSAIVVSARFAFRANEACYDGGECFAVGTRVYLRLLAAVPLMYLVALGIWAILLRILLRRSSRRVGSRWGWLGFSFSSRPLILLASVAAGGAAGVVVFIVAVTVVPAGFAWRATADRPADASASNTLTQ